MAGSWFTLMGLGCGCWMAGPLALSFKTAWLVMVRVSEMRREGWRGRWRRASLPPRARAFVGSRPRPEVWGLTAAPGVLGAWVDVDNQLARIAPVLAVVGVWVRFMRDSGMPPRLGVVNPDTDTPFTVRGEVTVVPNPDGGGWVFQYHVKPGGLPLPLGVDAVAAASRVAYLLGLAPAGGCPPTV
jgi:hypothetical protein